MTFKPTTEQLELIATLGHARASTARIAAALGITEAEFLAWRLAAARMLDPATYRKLMVKPPPAATVTNPRIVAERLFEGDSAPEGMAASIG